MTASGCSIYDDDHDNVFGQAGNEHYYLDETNLLSCREKVTWIRGFIEPGIRLLDAGANYGHFLHGAQDMWDASGFELSPQAVQWSREHLRVRNCVGSVYSPPCDLLTPFDAVTLWDVIEHLDRPIEALGQLRLLLKPGGYLFISTPDAGSLVARLLGRHWHYIDPVQHLNLFSFANLSLALKRAGFEVIQQRSFGRYYRLRYVFDRIAQLHRSGVLGCAGRIGQFLLRRFLNRAVYIKLGDVMGVVARRT
jgi:SAM-dependent methyltransferase